ncbi:MAG TPA: AAA family ATPase, partial [Gemmatimonadaceae bacterium]|nr:AAA family ATPase [Gemmatimonadaceae bacterium]
MLQLRALGNAEIETDRATLTPSQEIVFAAALYLVLERERKVTRTGLAELLWPAVDPSIRAHRFRQTLLQLKKLGFPVVADRDSVRISTQVHADIDQVKTSERLASERGGSLDFLPGYTPGFSEPYADWIDRKRSQVTSVCSRMLISKLEQERARANWNEVEEIARTVLRLDPYNESAVLAFSEACAMRGQKREAVRMIDDYLREIGGNADIRLPAQILRKRIVNSIPPSATVALRDSAFVGRESEVQVLTERLKQVQRGRGGACLIVGEPGIGKSKLASEFARFAGLQGLRTQTVSCQRTNVDRPLSVLVDLVPWLRDMPGALGCSQETLLALRRLTDFDSRVGELSSAAAESHALHRALRNAVFDLLDAVTDELPLLLIFDDVQWIDRISAEILAEMIAWSATKRLLLVMNSRDCETGLTDLFVLGPTDVLKLKALPDNAAQALLTSIVGEPVLDSSRSQLGWILEVGEGNPFFLQELAKHWVESGGRAEAPSSVAKVLTDRLARLNPMSLKVLQACTVLGQSSTIERVESLLDCSPHELLGAIQELGTAGMLSCTADSAELTPLSLRTRHDLLASAVFGGLGPAARAFLHRRAGMALEKELAGEWKSTAMLWACAFHWHHAGDRDRALSVVRSCAEHLLEVGLPQAASDTLDRALEYCSTDEQRLSVLTRQVHALQLAGQWSRSKEVLVTCRQIRGRTTSVCNQHDAFEILLFDASYRSSLDVLALLPDTKRCIECEDALPEHRIQAAVIALKVASEVDGLAMDSVYEIAEPLLEKAASNDPSRLEAEMVYHSMRGNGRRGIAAAGTLVDLARLSNDPIRV